MLNDRNLSAELALEATTRLCRRHPILLASDGQPVDVRAACRALTHWNGRGDTGSHGAVLWRQFFSHTVSPTPLANLWTVPFNPAHPVTTPRGFNTGLAAVRHTLADTVQYFQAHHIPLGEPLGVAQRYLTIPIPGCTDPEGCFNVIEPQGFTHLHPSGVYPDVSSGTSFIMATELTSGGPRTRTILTYSESANPASPHHTDQTRLFSRKQWVTERFTQNQINSDPHLQTTIVRQT